MDKNKLIKIAATTVFRKLPFDMVDDVVNNIVVLKTINRYTQERYGEDFWLGNYDFNPNFRLVCPPTSFDLRLGWPPMLKTFFIERTPFTEGENYAKFALNWRITKPLLVK